MVKRTAAAKPTTAPRLTRRTKSIPAMPLQELILHSISRKPRTFIEVMAKIRELYLESPSVVSHKALGIDKKGVEEFPHSVERIKRILDHTLSSGEEEDASKPVLKSTRATPDGSEIVYSLKRISTDRS
ncbi:hypothetical protein PAPYR_1409 [Paratrimastix pyriformis]|uniref:CDT1 Geminin-binding domain-containing protein n=1 Tax=Paratrimastix pyriformis TaxID=342808 RepID=A0ABQ8USV4_9EUKA|nr:hypothetical protein PAPYR_1409 [Paratrimastix pyriformis]